jgi:hypothetical protein
VQKVAADTGAPLTAAREVADEPVALVVKEMPARELLVQLADLLDYRWARKGQEGAWHYEIWQDLASKQREEALRQAASADARKRFREAVDLTLKMATQPPAQIEQLLQDGEQHSRELAKLPP